MLFLALASFSSFCFFSSCSKQESPIAQRSTVGLASELWDLRGPIYADHLHVSRAKEFVCRPESLLEVCAPLAAD